MLPRSSREYETRREQRTTGRRLKRLLSFAILVFLAYTIVTTLFIATVEQQSESMSPTLASGDRLVMVPLLYGPRIRLFGVTLPGFAPPRRGEVAAVRPGFLGETTTLRRLLDPFLRFVTLGGRRADEGEGWASSVQVKRVIGLPGDTVRVERYVAYVKPAGSDRFESEFTLSDRSYQPFVDLPAGAWEATDPFGPATGDVVVPPGHYFLLADKRPAGLDSRHWGTVPASSIHGRLVFRYWPPARLGRI